MSQTQPQPFDVKENNVEAVLEEVKAGRLSPEAALEQEKASEPVRVGITGPLQKMIDDAAAAQASTDVSETADNKVSPQNLAPSVKAAITDPPKKLNPNNYPEITVKVTKKVLEMTAEKGTYYDVEQKENIGKEPVAVLATPFVNALIRTQEIEVVRG